MERLHRHQPPAVRAGNPPHLFEHVAGVLTVAVTADKSARGRRLGRILDEDTAVGGAGMESTRIRAKVKGQRSKVKGKLKA